MDFLLRRDRGIAAAQAFFRKALALNPPLLAFSRLFAMKSSITSDLLT